MGKGFVKASQNRQRGPRDERGAMRERIVDAARLSFAEHGYAGTSMRTVARAADVDAALVHHYFASKSDLLDAATALPPEWTAGIQAAWAADPERRGEAIVRNVLRNWAEDRYSAMMKATLLAASHDLRTRARLIEIITRQLMGPATDHLGGREQLLRASLAASQLLGFMFMRYIWKIEPLATLSHGRVIAAVAPVIQRYLDGNSVEFDRLE